MTRWPYVSIVAAILALAFAVPLARSNTFENAAVTALIVALAGYGWNLLGGYCGQYSFGHAAFFGIGAYTDAVLQARFGVNAFVAFALALPAGALAGLVSGFLSFRAGLRGSYFALITLAFAEVLRIIANAAPVTGGAAGTLIRLDPGIANFQFDNRLPWLWIVLGCVGVAMALTRFIERRRFGAYLVAVRENEAAAAAAGVDAIAVKLGAITLSATLTALAGALYAQYFLFVDAAIAFGPWISIEALIGPIIGGPGTVFGPLAGTLALHFIGEWARTMAARIPGVDLAVFGALLIVTVGLTRDGLVGAARRLGRRWREAA